MTPDPTPDITPSALSRRRLFGRLGVAGAAGAVVAGGVLDGGRAEALTRLAGPPDGDPTTGPEPFRGVHQSGIITPTPARLVFAAFDLQPVPATRVQALLTTWTAAAEAMSLGRPVAADPADGEGPPDTGEVLGDPPSGLTITIGYGASLFAKTGLDDRSPAHLGPLPTFAGEQLDPAISGGDLCIQACAGDPLVAFHAVRTLARLGAGVVATRWLQNGFGRASTTTTAQVTPRNLMGFKDGTRNVTAQASADLETYVWADPAVEPGWLADGSYLVVRKIGMSLEKWDSDALDEQDDTFGRFKSSGAPLTGKMENDTPDFGAHGPDGSLVIPAHAHIRLAAFENNAGLRILRRGYSYTDGVDLSTHQLDSGLFFLAYMRDPAQFVTLQQKLSASDALNEYIQHLASAVFACPGGLSSAQDWGSQLFG